MKELYINNQLADIGNSLISLSLKSNIFSDVSKIVSNRSYTINLPRTHRNDIIFKNAYIPSIINAPVRVYCTVSYIEDGIQIIDKGIGILLRASDTYEVALTWGIIGGYRTMTTDSKKLTEIETEVINSEYPELKPQPIISNYGDPNGVIYSDYNSGFEGDQTMPKILPTVRVGYILSKISSRYGITFDFPRKAKDIINSMICPLTTMTRKCLRYKEVIFYAGGETGNFWKIYYNNNVNGLLTIDLADQTTIRATDNIDLEGRIKATSSGIFYMAIVLGDNTKEFNPEYKNGRWIVDEKVKVSLSKDDKFDITVPRTVTFEPFVAAVESNAELKAYQSYPVISNLPDMTCIDFIKEICIRCGVFPINSGSVDTLKFIYADAFNSPAIEWEVLSVKETSYSFSDFAQDNTLKYAVSGDSDYDARGILKVNNESLELSKDMFASKFMAIKDNTIPLYEIEEKDGEREAKFKKQKPVIGYEVQGDNNKSMFTFEGMDFETLIKNNYTEYQRIILDPVVIKVSKKFDAWELKSLDFSIPVFIRRLGRRYAIIGVNTGSNNIHEVELIQL